MATGWIPTNRRNVKTTQTLLEALGNKNGANLMGSLYLRSIRTISHQPENCKDEYLVGGLSMTFAFFSKGYFAPTICQGLLFGSRDRT